jgi:hypothetical protein
MLPLAVSAITTLANILVSDDRLPDLDPAARAATAAAKAKAEAGAHAVYSRGQSEFAQALEKVDPQPLILQALDEIHKLAAPDTSVDTLVQASAEPTSSDTASLKHLAALQKSIRDGGERLHQAARLGVNLDAKS